MSGGAYPSGGSCRLVQLSLMCTQANKNRVAFRNNFCRVGGINAGVGMSHDPETPVYELLYVRNLIVVY